MRCILCVHIFMHVIATYTSQYIFLQIKRSILYDIKYDKTYTIVQYPVLITEIILQWNSYV